MSIFDLFHHADINSGVKEWKNTPDSVLLDVRTREEYEEGYIPGSVNIPLSEIQSADTAIPDRQTPIFVHCLSGARSRQVEGVLKVMGYTRVKSIGGISAYTGKTERKKP